MQILTFTVPKKHVIIVALVLIAATTNAQQPPKFDATKAAGVIVYDAEKMIKKLKVEDNDGKHQMRSYIGAYNMEMYQLLDEHSTALTNLDALFDQQVKIAMQRRDRSQMNGVKAKIQEVIPPIREKVMKHELVLNSSLEPVLDDKQYNKWLKYQKSLKSSRTFAE